MDEHQKYGQPYPPPGYQPQQPPYGYPPPSQGYPPQGYPPQGYPQQGYPPAQGYYQQTPPVVAPPQYNQQQQSNSSSSTGFLQGWWAAYQYAQLELPLIQSGCPLVHSDERIDFPWKMLLDFQKHED